MPAAAAPAAADPWAAQPPLAAHGDWTTLPTQPALRVPADPWAAQEPAAKSSGDGWAIAEIDVPMDSLPPATAHPGESLFAPLPGGASLSEPEAALPLDTDPDSKPLPLADTNPEQRPVGLSDTAQDLNRAQLSHVAKPNTDHNTASRPSRHTDAT